MSNIIFLDMTLFEFAYYFCFWSCVGWALEVVVRTLETGGFENRGFLNGPFCPIYGFGVLMVTTFFRPIEHNPFILFLCCGILCTMFELLVGLIMEKIFDAKWWDYSNYKFNFKGYISLKISLLWGMGCVFVIKVVHPLVKIAVSYIPYTVGCVLLSIIALIVILDLIESIIEAAELKRNLMKLQQLANLLKTKSISLGENISDEVLDLKCKKEKLSAYTKEKSERFLEAFPSMSSSKYYDALNNIKNKFSKEKK